MIRDVKQTEPDKPWYLWFCPGANHAPHHAPQEYIDKYKGAFDDGYEAYREWVLPRMIERGILPEGTELTDAEPDARRHLHPDRPRASVGRAERRGEGDVLPDGRGVRRLLGVHRRAGRPHRRLPRGVRSARQHAHPLLRRQRRVGRGQPERLGQRGQDLRRLPRRPGSRTSRWSTSSAPPTPTTTTRPAGRWRSRRRTGCSSATPTRAASATRSSSTGPRASQARARCATSTTTRPTSCRPSSRRAGWRCPTSYDGVEQTPLAGRLDGATPSTTRRRADRRRRRSTTRCSAAAASGTRAGRPSPSTARWPA